DLGMAIINGGVDEGRETSTLDQDVARPQVAMEQGRTRRTRNELAQPAHEGLDPGAPRPVQQARGGEQPLFTPEADPVLSLTVVERHGAERIVDRPAIS